MEKEILYGHVRQFLEKKGIDKGPLVLGCSGGPDSKALLYLLSPYCRLKGISLLIAHVDHGWRKESAKEASSLQKEVSIMGWPFFLKTVDSKEFGSGNWESKGREIRLQFFSETCMQENAQALILGHHADDRAEGVLKRLFEGASLPFLGGMGMDSQMRGMRILRPLLAFPKKKIVEYLDKQGISYFSDPTNEDPSFLRGRMRSEMLPFLESSFGKQIGKNLCLFADETQEIAAYFSSLNRPLLDDLCDSSGLNLKEKLPLPEIQLRYLLKEWMGREGLFLSRSMILSAVKTLLSGDSGTFCSGSGGIVIRNGIISIVS